ncbi:MAG: AI-2E family transporter [Alphaproteobacteria bacterium]|nr:AI-2E family transporter [Alphaproteobacteria bacterium]
MSLQNQIKIWLLLLAVMILGLWVFRGILLPFILGMALAYLLDPVADQFVRWRFSRLWASVVILAIAISIFATAFLLIVPLALQQAIGLAFRLPGYVNQLQDLANERVPEIFAALGEERVVQFQNTLAELLNQGIGIVGGLIAQVMQSGLTLINALGVIIVTPVVAFYLLLDWDRLSLTFDSLLPRQHRDEIRDVLADIDQAMAGVIRGQGAVMIILSVFYGVTLSFAGLNYGVAIGLTTGLLSFVPYVGFLTGFVLSMGVGIVQFWPDGIMLAVIFGIFVVGQFIEANVLYPNFVGNSIGVHPVWLMFALFAFGLIFGLIGIVLAVPMIAITGVLVRFAVRKYKSSALYLGVDAEGKPNEPEA